MTTVPKVVVFDCDGVLVDSVSSWKTLHDHFGTDNSHNLKRFIDGEISDMEFMRLDIKMWKDIQDPIYRDELFRSYSGVKVMPGAKELVAELKSAGIFVAIVSAGVDLFVSSIAAMLKVDDWIANGFEFNDDDTLSDEGICRLHASKKNLIITRYWKCRDLNLKIVYLLETQRWTFQCRLKGADSLASIQPENRQSWPLPMQGFQ